MFDICFRGTEAASSGAFTPLTSRLLSPLCTLNGLDLPLRVNEVI